MRTQPQLVPLFVMSAALVVPLCLAYGYAGVARSDVSEIKPRPVVLVGVSVQASG